MKFPFAIVVHGGAGVLGSDDVTHDMELQYKEGLKNAIDAAYKVLEENGTAMDAVLAAVMYMENDPIFNAGRGSTMTDEKTHELDASVMDGSNLNAGSVACIRCTKNPILAAHAVMNSTPHVMLVGSAADAFVESNGCSEIVENSYFHTEVRLKEWEEEHAKKQSKKVHLHRPTGQPMGTVGAVALDVFGNLAAGTSTGGMSHKMCGRVGDTPIIGAGTYADNETCAVSCTGHGEMYIRRAAAFDVCAHVKYSHMTLHDAVMTVNRKVAGLEGSKGGGIIALNRRGEIAIDFTTKGMMRGYRCAGQPHAVTNVFPEKQLPIKDRPVYFRETYSE